MHRGRRPPGPWRKGGRAAAVAVRGVRAGAFPAEVQRGNAQGRGRVLAVHEAGAPDASDRGPISDFRSAEGDGSR